MSGNHEYISLKQASSMSGYSSDYIGQLIRQGKLPGKQVFSNVAWMTTEEAMLAYIKEKKSPHVSRGFSRLQEQLRTPENLTKLYRGFLWSIVLLSTLIVIFLAFLVAVGIDHRLEQQSLEVIAYDD